MCIHTKSKTAHTTSCNLFYTVQILFTRTTTQTITEEEEEEEKEEEGYLGAPQPLYVDWVHTRGYTSRTGTFVENSNTPFPMAEPKAALRLSWRSSASSFSISKPNVIFTSLFLSSSSFCEVVDLRFCFGAVERTCSSSSRSLS